MAERIPGYTYGRADLPRSPISLEEVDLLKKTLMFTDEDVRYLRMSREILADQIEPILDVWYGFVASHPHLVRYFSHRNGEPNQKYLAGTRPRFGQWILDTAAANYDQQWLDYQYEIALRHHRTKKNQTDGVDSVEIINFRYLPAFIQPVTLTLKPFLANKGRSKEEVDRMYEAWVKTTTLHVILWSYPYVKDGDF